MTAPKKLKTISCITFTLLILASCKKKPVTYYYEQRNSALMVHIDSRCKNLKNGIITSAIEYEIEPIALTCCGQCMSPDDLEYYWNLLQRNAN